MRVRIVRIFIFVFICSQAIAQEPSLFTSLIDIPVTEVTLITDIKNCIKKKHKEEYQPGQLTFNNGPLQGRSFELQLRARGNMRKQVCYIPPLKFKFKKGTFPYHKIKWVNVCRDNTDMEEHLLEEYLVYKIYEELTDHSYRTILMRVNYCSPDTPDEIDFTRYAYLIEPEKELAQRFEGKPYHPKVISASNLSPDGYNLMMAFEYLIANTDWAIENQHNLTLITDRKINTIIPVPYDFDYTGFVNTSYATPNTYTPIQEVTERYNRGHCMDEESAMRTMAHILSKKEAIIQLVNDFDILSEKNRRQKVRFLEQGFKLLEDERWVKRIFCRDCKEFKK